VTRFDVSNLLPAWSFFAPNPGCHDLHLVYRDWFGESAGQWQQFYINSKLGWRWIWNPSRYPSKGLIDLIQSLFYNIKAFSDHPKSVLLSQSYISLLYFVMQQPQVKGTTHRQFAIVANQSFNKCSSLIVKYLSEKHRAEL
jgi:hypothetical protein